MDIWISGPVGGPLGRPVFAAARTKCRVDGAAVRGWPLGARAQPWTRRTASSRRNAFVFPAGRGPARLPDCARACVRGAQRVSAARRLRGLLARELRGDAWWPLGRAAGARRRARAVASASRMHPPPPRGRATMAAHMRAVRAAALDFPPPSSFAPCSQCERHVCRRRGPRQLPLWPPGSPWRCSPCCEACLGFACFSRAFFLACSLSCLLAFFFPSRFLSFRTTHTATTR